MRESIIQEIIELKKKDENIFVLDADCSHSTQSILYSKEYSDSFLNVGIAEQNLIGVATGLALMGKKVIVNCFANFLCLRGLDFVQQLVAKQNLPIIFLGHYSALSAAKEGGTHHSINSFSIMMSIPNVNFYNPFGESNVKQCLNKAYCDSKPAYINVSKIEYEEPLKFKNKLNVISVTPNSKCLIVCSGVILEQVIGACELLKEKNINVSILAISDFSELSIINEIAYFDDVWIVDESYEWGGIYPVITSLLNKKNICKKINHICIDGFTRSGSINDLYNLYGLSADKIASVISNCY